MRTRGSSAFAWLGVLLLFAWAAPSEAVVGVPFRNGRLTIQIEALGTTYSLRAPATSTATGTVNVTRTATTLSSFTLPANALYVLGGVVPVSDPTLYPITGLRATFTNQAATFASLPGGGFGGTMELVLPGFAFQPGVVDVCVLTPCSDPFQSPVVVPLTVVGVGGELLVEDLINFTIAGGPWTLGTATVPVEGGQESESGSLTALGDGYLRVRLVTPIAIEVDTTGLPVQIPSQLAAFGVLTLEIAPVPEPGAAASGLAGIAALGGLVHRRRRAAPRRGERVSA
jgi:hypothetical protein